MDQVHDSLMNVKTVLDDKDKEVDTMSVGRIRRKIKNIDVDLQGIKRDMLPVEDYESLARRAASYLTWKNLS